MRCWFGFGLLEASTSCGTLSNIAVAVADAYVSEAAVEKKKIKYTQQKGMRALRLRVLNKVLYLSARLC